MNMPALLRLSVLFTGALSVAGTPYAQEEGSDADDPEATEQVVETIVVTGSRILGAGQSVSPVVSVGQAQFEENPNVQLADFLVENITANNGQLTLTDESNQSGRFNGPRQTSINLWSLGSENSLTLLNGSRLVNAPAANTAGFFVTDVNSIIPGIAMQRVDVLLDGGSAIYGTDAVAGVVNFVPRYGFEGLDLRAQTELFPDSLSDTTSASLSGLWGTKFNDERGAFLVAFDIRETYLQDAEKLGLNHGNVPQFTGNETAAEFEDLLFEGGDAYNWSTPSTGMGMGAVPGVPLADPLCGQHDQLDTPYYYNGEIFPVGSGATDPANEGLCAGYPTPDLDGRDSTRLVGFTALSYDINDEATVSFELGFSDREIRDFNQSDTNSGGGLTNYTLPADHPGVLYNQSISADWAAQAGMPIQGRLNEFPLGYENDKVFGNEMQVYNARVGFELAITENVGLKLGVSKGEADAEQSRHLEYIERYDLAANGLGGPNCDPLTGTPGQGECMYYNPFLNAQLHDAESLGLANSSELLNWMINPLKNTTYYFNTKLFGIDAILDVKSNWSLGGGEIEYVVGMEWREEEASYDYSEPMKQDNVLDGITTGLVPFEGAETVSAVYGEMVFPFTETFTVQAALRREEYESVGSTTNGKLGMMWQPNDRMFFRAAYGTSFKAPTIIHTSTTIGRASIPTGPSGGRRGGFGVTTIVEGSPDIVPQTADHYSIGGDFTLFKNAGVLDNMTLSISYVKFEFDDRIVLLQERDRLPSSADGVDLCGETANNEYTVFYEFENNDPNGRPCFEGFDLDGSGDLQLEELTAAYRLFVNLATAELEGIDMRIRSNWEFGFGNLSWTLGGTYTLDYTIQDNPLEPPVDAVGVTGVLGASNANVPELRLNTSLGLLWGDGRQHTSLTGRYSDEIVDDETFERVVGHDHSWDLRHSWDVTNAFNLALTVRNVFETSPQRPGNPLGQLRDGVRSYFLNLSYRLE